ncbi:hypothetical protein DER44DRAFT_837708 [Fusarium oxysporum]|nr:hypothetical protein DER44DRAFT_837708 [Fusarium oxysporum]
MAHLINAVAVIGAGGMGLAVILADYSRPTVDAIAKSLQDNGQDVVALTLNITDKNCTTKRVHEVDLLGTAHIFDAFLEVMPPGSCLISISSMAADLMPSTVYPGLERHLATASMAQLLQSDEIDFECSSVLRFVIIRIQAAAQKGQEKGIRFNTLETEVGAAICSMIDGALISRPGTVGDIANALAFLASPDATFITRADLLVDGGIVAPFRSDNWGDGNH